jgi:hypothetical protein
MTVHQLRYTGDHGTVFQTGNVGLLEPGEEFAVPGELLLRFMRRPDVDHAGECPKPPCRCGEEPQPQPAGPEDQEPESEPEGSEASCSDQAGGGGEGADGEGAPDARDSASRVQEADTSAGRSAGRGRGSSNARNLAGETGTP